MLEAILDDLSAKLDALLRYQNELQQENEFLRETMAKIKLEQSRLQEKNQLAANKTKETIAYLKKQLL